ncbi:hypothetical protein [Oceanirhabdus seepicola]|uniref:Uncharacterized protein n=1 Tax=Oceanirhabdus seepicola TaxID=2828781 RepID=A0A9J6P5D0_9CLOT|nr:hypothetical protein [Oceanirhabdus seepicola]MCM1991305.1 hypothetical protein [Oceanirhabdus seepicola]
MTAEIGILNRQGVALAADSAVTINSGGQMKILNTANKLFSLSENQPIGLMVYGNGDFMDVPWEIIIKLYRTKLGEKTYNTLKEYCDDFFDFIINDNRFSNKISEEKYIYVTVNNFIKHLERRVYEHINSNYETTPNTEEICKILDSVTKQELIEIDRIPFLQGFDFNYSIPFLDKYNYIIEKVIKSNFDFEINADSIGNIKQTIVFLITKDIFNNFSGVVIAGYGENEIFPSLYEYHVEGIIDKKLKYKLNEENHIQALGGNDSSTASIMPFAQKEMVHSLLTGINPDVYQFIANNLLNVFGDFSNLIERLLKENNVTCELDASVKDNLNNTGKDILQSILKTIQDVQNEKFIQPIIQMVSMLPKDELASMAESLVNITSFKRKFTLDAETVGGPIDVAVISKNDGFVWIKRKHYFNKDLNYRFFKNH